MNRLGLSRIRLSSLHLQQGLFASLALLVTLIGGQQLVRFEHATQPVQTVLHQPAQQTHFSAIGSSAEVISGYALTAADETQIANTEVPQERWVF
ncbi:MULTISPECIES: hypothetical protein [unclassified Pseudomonas]|uniref:hypothetical protein n=1 Tax=unclassified Pseudomonas TaxID=196821 RepID=UPI001472BF9D|nr:MULTISPECIES: hypothetical protein [unclassified Pseudomonas]NMY35765.1 hypothetical protein [Pseudomonas sp. WS 5078]NMY58506.1 hypothetical protein [Pseudomonas sp. WS 5354]NMY74015.1 hypothetical protein [Pseudomonas sp. WS 5071]